jgi:hypothetical protein
MSVELHVYIADNRLPTWKEWQSGLEQTGSQLVMEEFDTRSATGFRPCKSGDKVCGFEYYFESVEDLHKEFRDKIGQRNRVITFRLGASMDELDAAMLAAAVLTEMADGVFFDPQGGVFATGRGVFDMITQDQEARREWRRRKAEKDSAITDSRCPQCGAPCPSYRKTCKACGAQQNR